MASPEATTCTSAATSRPTVASGLVVLVREGPRQRALVERPAGQQHRGGSGRGEYAHPHGQRRVPVGPQQRARHTGVFSRLHRSTFARTLTDTRPGSGFVHRTADVSPSLTSRQSPSSPPFESASRQNPTGYPALECNVTRTLCLPAPQILGLAEEPVHLDVLPERADDDPRMPRFEVADRKIRRRVPHDIPAVRQPVRIHAGPSHHCCAHSAHEPSEPPSHGYDVIIPLLPDTTHAERSGAQW